MASFWQDVRFGLRMLARKPAFTIVVVLTLSIGVGSVTTIFSWIQSVVRNPLPGVAETEMLVALEATTPSGEFVDSSFADLWDYRDRNHSLEDIVAFQVRPLGWLGDEGRVERAWSMVTTGSYFSGLGVRPFLGRFYTREEGEIEGGPMVAVVSYRFWMDRLGGDSEVIGSALRLNRQSVTIIGVAPRGFVGTIPGEAFDLWFPIGMVKAVLDYNDILTNRDARWLHSIARLRPGVTPAQAQEDLLAIARVLEKEYPEDNVGMGITVLPFSEYRVGVHSALAPLLGMLLSVAGLVLLVGAANIASLLLARGQDRRGEMSLRLALGASPKRLLRQWVTETSMLGLVGGAGGVLVALWLADFLRLFIPPSDFPLALPTTLHPSSLVLALLLSLATGVLLGVWAGVGAGESGSRTAIMIARGSGRNSPRTGRIHGVLVAAEVAMALVALIGAGLLVRSLQESRNVNLGFRGENVGLVSIDLQTAGYQTEEALEFLRKAVDGVAALPGVETAAIADWVPLGLHGGNWQTISVDGYVPVQNENMKIYRSFISPDYLDLMGMPLVRGRRFDDRDRPDSQPAVIVNQAMAERFWPDQDPLGRILRFSDRVFTVVGLVGNIKYRRLDEPPKPFFYMPAWQFYRSATIVHFRSQSDPGVQFASIRQVLSELDPEVAVYTTLTLQEYSSVAVFRQTLSAHLASALGITGLLLAAIGVYGVLAYSVSRRSQEIGVRVALGARRSDILRLVIWQGMVPVLIGAVIGVGAALFLGGFLESLLFGVSSTDPVAYAAVVSFLVVISLIAAYVPARRAANVDPMVALRYE